MLAHPAHTPPIYEEGGAHRPEHAKDRAWCEATEIDFDSTLVGGSPSLVEKIVTDP
ncbi:MAG: hypothetical protein ACRDPJ_17530 [Nocardioidaceae bacterium]